MLAFTIDHVRGRGLGLWTLGFGECQELVGEYIPSAATVLCGWGKMFQLVHCVLLGFVVVTVVWKVSMISWSRGLVSRVLCSGMRCPLWW